MKVLGISPLDKDATVTLVEDGEIIYAAGEERFTRIKLQDGFPWNALADALRSLQTSTVFDLVLGGMFVGMFVAGGRALWRMRKSYFLYAGVILLVSFSYNTGAFLPYMGLPRHCLLAFPLFLPMATWARGRLETLVLVGGFLGMAVLAFSYAAKIFWVP